MYNSILQFVHDIAMKLATTLIYHPGWQYTATRSRKTTTRATRREERIPRDPDKNHRYVGEKFHRPDILDDFSSRP